ncbi:AlwI family type II restriction endonuclease [uncultured Tyzzerella sp.]|uniref:AlwI family type II restriction endonuclease n=1 Tax=uncultured Tyzzerella sp. TaxID=2321398 RepID=UPI002941ED40|nr:AlwI family type II restriction endonuclease [uncultured Tyzzerella sp.]
MAVKIPYKSFCWSLGTTSFRTKNFNKTIEQQLALLNEFWSIKQNESEIWSGNTELQSRYYDFIKEKQFIEGNAKNKSKDAREKTSGLVDIGLITENRMLTEAGLNLLNISKSNDFSINNNFGIAKDSYIYLKQLLKSCNEINGDFVRPFIVLIYVLLKVEKLTLDEFTYLLPLCTNEVYTEQIIEGIRSIRKNETSIDEIIINRLIKMDNYSSALELLLTSDITEELLCEIGLNRKSRNYDKVYFKLYNNLYDMYINRNDDIIPLVYLVTKDIKIGKWWRSYLFNTSSENAIKKQPKKYKNATIFDNINSEEEFKIAFFKIMHLFKAKATLSDYIDLNRRYIKTTDIILFEDNVVKLDIVPKYFFKCAMSELYLQAYRKSEILTKDCSIKHICSSLIFDEVEIIKGINKELSASVKTLDEAHLVLDDNRYKRLHHLIDTKFTDENIITLLNHFEMRNDNEIRAMVTDNADIPTIFEYVLGILWYKISEKEGKILDYMKLSLDADLLPKTHASGGEADIVYEYSKTENYPEHTLLIEATLSDSTNQRRMEMEPVSRHLGQHLIRTGNLNSYCIFITNFLNINVIADFRGRKNMPYYDNKDYSKNVLGMKIIPLQTLQLKKIIQNKNKYKDLYKVFEQGFKSSVPPHNWYDECIVSKL